MQLKVSVELVGEPAISAQLFDLDPVVVRLLASGYDPKTLDEQREIVARAVTEEVYGELPDLLEEVLKQWEQYKEQYEALARLLSADRLKEKSHG